MSDMVLTPEMQESIIHRVMAWTGEIAALRGENRSLREAVSARIQQETDREVFRPMVTAYRELFKAALVDGDSLVLRIDRADVERTNLAGERWWKEFSR